MYTILLGSVIGPRVAGDLGVSNQNAGKQSQMVAGERVAPPHINENQGPASQPEEGAERDLEAEERKTQIPDGASEPLTAGAHIRPRVSSDMKRKES